MSFQKSQVLYIQYSYVSLYESVMYVHLLLASPDKDTSSFLHRSAQAKSEKGEGSDTARR